MRKLFGLLIAVIAMLFLGLAFTQMARAETPSCESALAEQITKLIQSDHHRILDMQFELTAMKLAAESLANNQKTAEAYVRHQEDLIQKLDDKGIREKLRILYQKNGEAVDTDRIQSAVQETVDKAKKANYFKRATRFKNKDLSAYVLARYISDQKPKPTFDENDASILWLRSEISEGVEAKSYRGSQAANLQEVSTRVAQLTGVAGTVGKTKEELTVSIAAMETVISGELDKIARKFTDEQKKSCAEMSTCATCGADDPKNRITDDHKRKALNKVIRSIGDAMLKDEKVKAAAIEAVVEDLKSKGISVERDPAAVQSANDAAKKLKHPLPDPSGEPTGLPSSVPSSAPSTAPSPVTKGEDDPDKLPPVIIPGTKKIADPKIKTESDGQMGSTKKSDGKTGNPVKVPSTAPVVPEKKTAAVSTNWVKIPVKDAQCTDGAVREGHYAQVRIFSPGKGHPMDLMKVEANESPLGAVQAGIGKYVGAEYVGNGPIYMPDGSANGYLVSGGTKIHDLNCAKYDQNDPKIDNLKKENSVFVRYHPRQNPGVPGKYTGEWRYKVMDTQKLCGQLKPATGKAAVAEPAEDLVEEGQIDLALQSGPGVLRDGKNLLEGYNGAAHHRSYIGVKKDGEPVVIEADGNIGSYCLGNYLKAQGVRDLLHRDSNVSDAAFRDDSGNITGYPTPNPAAKATTLLVI